MKMNRSFQINSLLKMICDRLKLFNFYLRKIVLQEVCVCVGGGGGG